MTYQIDPDGLVYGALDLARRTGVCVGNPFVSPLCETWMLNADNRAERFSLLRARMIPWLIRWRPKLVFIEKPMDARQMGHLGTPIDTQISLTGLVAIAEEECNRRGIETKLCDRQEVLGHFTGVKRYKVKDEGKKACVARCAQLKYSVTGYDEADAAAMWDFGCARELPKSYALHGVGRALAKRQEDDERRDWPRARPSRKPSKRGKTLFDMARKEP